MPRCGGCHIDRGQRSSDGRGPEGAWSGSGHSSGAGGQAAGRGGQPERERHHSTQVHAYEKYVSGIYM